MASQINYMKFLLIVAALVMMVAAALAGKTFSVDFPAMMQDSYTSLKEVSLKDYGSWNPPPKVAEGVRLGPVPRPHDQPGRYH
ncbi:unnamed protein product [Arabis nemorensis]|uniref:Transmembrane protein n=1 Tax=Arabis nemorensis TaxID=586526 RepID=A0A565CHH7_9BRAS|nr:unnamed protein product [Arabis nemorensis]